MKEELKQAIEEAAIASRKTYVYKGLEYYYLKEGLKLASQDPSILRHCDPEIMKQAGWIPEKEIEGYKLQLEELEVQLKEANKAGWVREEEWISVEDRLPKIKKHVLVKYYKHKKGNWSGNTGVFIIQAYYKEQPHYYHDGSLMRIEKCWYDYTDRLIWDTKSQSKNKVISWKILNHTI